MSVNSRRPSDPLAARIAVADWSGLEAGLWREGFAVLPAVLTPMQCETLAAQYAETNRFRSRIVMQRYGFGRGEYQYFRYPLPDAVQTLRQALYPQLAPIANRWQAALRRQRRFPETLDDWLARCHDAGQCRPTPLLLRYQAGDYTCLHQDLYGELVFPFQAIVLLSQPGRDFSGGELVLTERRQGQAGRAAVVPLQQGDAALIAVNHRPTPSVRGFRRAALHHGVSRVQQGLRHTLGVIFHDAQ